MEHTVKKLLVIFSLSILLISIDAYAYRGGGGGYRGGEDMERRPYDDQNKYQQQQDRDKAQGYEHGYQQGNSNNSEQSPTIVVPQQPDLYDQELQIPANSPY